MSARFSTVPTVQASPPAAVFFAYADAPARRAALAAPPGSPERRSLPAWARIADRVARSLVQAVGGYGGDFASILASLRSANRSNVIFSTVDRVGIPLVLLAELGIVRRPIV